MAISILIKPDKQFASTETVTIPKLNQLGRATGTISGSVDTSDLATASITAVKTKVDAYNYATGILTAGVYALTYSPATAPTALVDGLEIWFKSDSTITGGVALNTGVGLVNMYKNVTQTLERGDIVAGQIVGVRYNSALPAPVSAAGFEVITEVMMQAVYKATTAGTAPNFTATIAPPAGVNAVTLLALQGRPIVLKMHADGAGADKLALTVGTNSSLASTFIKKNFDQATEALDLRQNQEVVVIYDFDSDTFQMQSQVGVSPFVGGPVADGRNIIIKNNGSNPTRDVDVTADSITLQASTTGYRSVASVSLSISLSATGVNGLDTGTGPGSLQAAWYYVWIISNGTLTKGLLSLSASAPTMPTGYTYKALIGTVYNTTAATYSLVTFYSLDRQTWVNPYLVGATITGQTSYFALSTQATEWAEFKKTVPPSAKTVSGVMGNTGASGRSFAIAANSSGLGAVYGVGLNSGTAIDSYTTAWYFSIPLQVTQDFNMKMNTTDATYKIQVTGYTI